MPTMPYWMNKTREMVAMDRWFSGPDLVAKYTNAINSVLASQLSNVLPATSDVLDNELAGKQASAFAHFGSDWLNPRQPELRWHLLAARPDVHDHLVVPDRRAARRAQRDSAGPS